MTNDTIADMLTRIRNANRIKIQVIRVQLTKVTKSIAQILKDEQYIKNFEEIEENGITQLLITLKYKGKKQQPVLTSLKRISKQGLRVYVTCKELPKVLGGYGIAILSTSFGVMTEKQARRNGLGGELLCYIW
uniref:Ribosomal protein S8 n=1 Tax=Gloeochaete wittrockiana TaxID=38269 RepID=A0A3G1IVZ6_9EUKA|nr:ribosomal protein S8 [Gloeochaete wittrockiana]ASQ40224.1 ribosomal protein S8 [Gloeochaete wittrockiana]